ncbi:MAG: phosphoesterase [Clostridia bacterium]|nr:phosphoesterase [Clostridia bacterium]
MKICYDLHIHSALSPCADNHMTPVNIVAYASAVGLEMIAVADHNSIENVLATMHIGEALDIVVVPAMELQTAEDIHILCLFPTYEQLSQFYKTIRFSPIGNKPDIFGDQLIIDEQDNIVGRLDRLLSMACNLAEYEVFEQVKQYGGVAIPAHIDRDTNGMLAILGDIPSYYVAVELSSACPNSLVQQFSPHFNVILDSDSHSMDTLGTTLHTIDLRNKSAQALIDKLYLTDK